MVTYRPLSIYGDVDKTEERAPMSSHQWAIPNSLPSSPSEEPAGPLAFWGPTLPLSAQYSFCYVRTTYLALDSSLYLPVLAITNRLIFSCPLRNKSLGNFGGPLAFGEPQLLGAKMFWLSQGGWPSGGATERVSETHGWKAKAALPGRR